MRERNQERREWKREGKRGVKCDWSSLCMPAWKCHNEANYLVQIIYATNKKVTENECINKQVHSWQQILGNNSNNLGKQNTVW